MIIIVFCNVYSLFFLPVEGLFHHPFPYRSNYENYLANLSLSRICPVSRRRKLVRPHQMRTNIKDSIPTMKVGRLFLSPQSAFASVPFSLTPFVAEHLLSCS